jgi:RNA polymerase sigma-70 factor (ECF subfamily)
MLADAHEAEDLVQETYLRWHAADHSAITSPEAWLVTVMTRLSIDALRRTSASRVEYVGHWLPEPIGAEYGSGTDYAAELESDLSIAFLVLLERLAPEERAAFLLRDVFDTPYDEIAQILGLTQPAVRQMIHRARERVRTDRARFDVSPEVRSRLLDRFLAAVASGDQDELLSLFASDATLTSDGGGKAPAARRVLVGADRIVKLLLGMERKRAGAVGHRVAVVNGELALLTTVDGKLFAVTSFQMDGKHISDVYRIMNPDKLGRIGPSVREYPPRSEP